MSWPSGVCGRAGELPSLRWCPGDEAVDGDGAILADAVGAVGGLVFGGGFHHGSRWTTKSAAVRLRPCRRLEADEEEVALAALEGLHAEAAFGDGGGAVEAQVADGLVASSASKRSRRLVNWLKTSSGGAGWRSGRGPGRRRIWSWSGRLVEDQAGMAAGLAQAREVGQQLKALAELFQAVLGAAAQLFVKGRSGG